MTNRYWYNNHLNTPLYDAVSSSIPAQDKCPADRPALEALRLMSNAYHDIFNNGCCNWDQRGGGYREACKSVGLQPINLAPLEMLTDLSADKSYNEKTWDRLDEQVTAVLLAATNECITKDGLVGLGWDFSGK